MSEQTLISRTEIVVPTMSDTARDRASVLLRVCSLAAIICVLAVLPQVAVAETVPGLAGDPWVQLLSSSPIAAALAWAMTLNARREKERDDVRVKLEELSLKRNEDTVEIMRGLQTELGKLAVSQSSLALAVTSLERYLATRREV